MALKNEFLETNAMKSGGDFVVARKYDRVFRALRAASSVRSHLDFYRWLQDDIRPFLPHQTLIVAWGDFALGDINYDVTSSLPGVTTQALDRSLDLLMVRLFADARQSGRSWLVLDELGAATMDYGKGVDSFFYQQLASGVNTLLVQATRDERGGQDCLYVFSASEEHADFDPLVLDLLMPHLDAALRRVKCLTRSETGHEEEDDPAFDALTAREQEVLHWVSEGKSNEEIGAILGISHNTVKNHLKRIFNKMGVTARSQAVRVYMQGSSQAI